MSDIELIDAVAHVTGEDAHEIRRRGFILTGPDTSGSDLDPECMLDLIDLPEAGTVDWDAVLGDGGFRSPFYTQAQQARRNAKASMRAGTTKQLARAA